MRILKHEIVYDLRKITLNPTENSLHFQILAHVDDKLRISIQQLFLDLQIDTVLRVYVIFEFLSRNRHQVVFGRKIHVFVLRFKFLLLFYYKRKFYINF